MKDRDLVRLAGIAIGLNIPKKLPSPYITYSDEYGFQWWNIDGSRTTYEVNPLNDNADAFDLQVKLGTEVYVDNHPDGCTCVEAESHTHRSGRFVVNFWDSEADQHKAARKVITRVGYEIGKKITKEEQ